MQLTTDANAVAESFFATLKVELLHRQVWPTRAAAQLAIFEYIEGWYNRQRRHSTLAYATPTEYEALAQERAIALYLVQVACRHTGVVDRHRHGRPRPDVSVGRGTRFHQSPDS